MKYYQQLSQYPVFTYLEASKVIGNIKLTTKNLKSLINKGFIHRIRQNLYTCVNFATQNDNANRFQIASKINQQCFVAYHSAFEYYGCYNQVYSDVQVASLIRFEEFNYDYYNYKMIQTNNLIQVQEIDGIKVTTIERTIVDSINMIGKVMDAEELVKCLDLVLKVDENKLKEMLQVYNKEILYRKVGYVLSYYKNEFNLSNDFFAFCMINGKVSNKGCFSRYDKYDLKYNSTWGLYTFKDLRKLANKGGDIDV